MHLTPFAPAAYAVIGSVFLGPPDTPVTTETKFCSIPCATEGVHEMTEHLARSDHDSASTLTWREGRPVGLVATGGRVWLIRVYAIGEL